MPELSIIVPIYNGEEYLEKCIDSILIQSYKDFELILVDDGSTDASLSICERYAEADSRVVVYHKENGGLVSARKSGLSLAKGEYIGFVDCDDYIDDDMYSNLMQHAVDNGSDIVASGIIYDNVFSRKESLNCIKKGSYDKKLIKDEIIPKMLIYSGFVNYGIIPGVVTKVFKRSVLEKALPNVDDDITIGEDVAITAYSIMNCNSLSVIDSASYHYIQYENSMVRVFNPKRIEKIEKLYECISKIDCEAYQKQVTLYMCYLIFNAVAACVKKSNYSKKEAKAAVKSILERDLSKKVFSQADFSSLSFKNKIKIILMKHNLVSLLMMLL